MNNPTPRQVCVKLESGIRKAIRLKRDVDWLNADLGFPDWIQFMNVGTECCVISYEGVEMEMTPTWDLVGLALGDGATEHEDSLWEDTWCRMIQELRQLWR